MSQTPTTGADAVDAAIAHVAATPSPLAIIPMEDLLGDIEQPNLPGTTALHPNWRRRHNAPIGDLLAQPVVTQRLGLLSERAEPNATADGKL